MTPTVDLPRTSPHRQTPKQQLAAWFEQQGWRPFRFQRQAWNAYLSGQSGLIHATTGTGKTYAAWLGSILEWLSERGTQPTQEPPPRTRKKTGPQAQGKPRARSQSPPLRVLWVTPLRALAADTEKALQLPLADFGIPWTLETRTGDTPAAVRARQRKRLPTVLVTTPESLSVLLSRQDAQGQFADLRLVVVDEWHELVGNKRGVQTELALARLRRWRPDLRVWGLSATLGNLQQALEVLLGQEPTTISLQSAPPGKPVVSAATDCPLISGGPRKDYVVETLIPDEMERFPWAGHLGSRMVRQVLPVIHSAQSSLVFTNTRFQAESWYRSLLEANPNWAGRLALHHGSLDQETRCWVESALANSELLAVVCTSSLDLGVDFRPVDRVLQVGSPKGVARLLQRAGRSGHQPGVPSRITCVPTHAFELVEFAAAREAIITGQLEARTPLMAPLDVLAQHLVTVAAAGGFRSQDLLAEVRQTSTYSRLKEEDWNWVLDFVSRGGQALAAYPEYQRVALVDDCYQITSESIARRHRLSIGTITSDASLMVQYRGGPRIGTIEENFAAKLSPGDVFVFGGKTLETVRIHDMTVWVKKAKSRSGLIPRWWGGRMPLSTKLAAGVRAKLEQASGGVYVGPEMQAVRPVLELQQRLSHLPAADELLIEQVTTREGHHLFVFPFEGRLVHEGLATVLAHRLSRQQPISFSLTANDYGIELLSADRVSLQTAIEGGLFRVDRLAQDIQEGLNSVEMARRQFREIARVAGLVFPGFPGSGKTAKQLQASAGLLFDVFRNYDAENRLLQQAYQEVLERQLEHSRLAQTLQRLEGSRMILKQPERPTPLAFPLLVDRLRERLSSEKLADRVRRMQVSLERAAQKH